MVSGLFGNSDRLRRIGGRVLRLAARLIVGLAVAAICAVLLLLLAPVRGGLLDLGLRFVDGNLPGELHVGRADWPRLGRLEFADVVWLAADGDSAAVATLARVDRLVLALDVRALRDRDVRIDSLEIRLRSLDVPAITAAFPPTGLAPADSAADSVAARARPGPWKAAFPRAGALPGLPSFELRRLELAVAAARVAPDLTLADLRATARVVAAAGQQPAAVLRLGGLRVRAAGASPFALDLDTLTCVASLDTATSRIDVDSLAVVIAAAGPPVLAARWRELAPLRLAARGHARWRGRAWTGAADLELQGPGARLLGDALPQGLAAADFDTVAAKLHAEGEAGPDSIRVAVAVDLGATPWLARARLAGRAEFAVAAPRAGTFALDTLDVGIDGCSLRGSGVLEDDILETRVAIDLATPFPVGQALVPGAAQVEGSVHLEATVTGPAADPVLALDLRAATAAGPVVVPHVEVSLRGNRDRVRVGFAADGGLARGGRVWLDSARGSVDLRPVLGADYSVPERLTAALACDLAAPGDAGRAALRLRADLAPTAPLEASVELDTISLDIPGLAVHGSGRRDAGGTSLSLAARLVAPCALLELAVPPLQETAYAADLALSAAGTRDDPLIDLRLTGSCDTPIATVPGVEIAARGGWRDLQATVRAGGGVELRGRAAVDSLVAELAFRPAGGDTLPVRAGIVVRRGPDSAGLLLAAAADSVLTVRLDTLAVTVAEQSLRLSAPAVVRWDTTAHELTLSPLALAGSAGLIEAAGRIGRNGTRLEANVDLDLTEPMLRTLAPSEFWSENGGLDLGVVGGIDLEATGEAAHFQGLLDVEVRPHRSQDRLGVRLDLRLAEGDSSGLGARFALHLADTTLLHGEVLWPGRFVVGRGEWIGDPARMLKVTIPEQTLPLAPLRRFQPEGMTATGDVMMSLAANVPVAAGDSTAGAGGGSLGGALRTQKLKVSLANNSRLEVEADVAIEGTPADPRLTGQVRIPSGFLRIPEIPRNLHPDKGKPLLWKVAARDTLYLGEDASVADLQGWRADEDYSEPPAFLPDLDLVIDAPGNLRIHGYGLEVEVAARVNVRRGFDAKGRPGPALDGDVHAVRGTLRFMNRTFAIRVAEITFTGSVPANPLLDLQLEANVDGTTVRLRATGRADSPVIDLTSDPEMDKADIMAFLLFGRPLNDLDADQRGMAREQPDAAQQMRENLAGLALAFGTADLQSSVSSTFGVDIVEVGSDSKGGSTLTAGKFINPKLLVKYNASLEKSGTYFVTLEYMLTQVFRVVSTYGQGEEASGLELKWERRY